MKKLMLCLLLLLCGSILFAQKEPCDDIKKITNEFKETTTFSMPLSGDLGIHISKVIHLKTTLYNLIATADFSSASFSAKGVFIKLANGHIMKFEDAEITPRVLSLRKYRYYASTILEEEDLELLSKNKIIKFGVYSQEIDVSEKKSDKYIKWINCLINSL